MLEYLLIFQKFKYLNYLGFILKVLEQSWQLEYNSSKRKCHKTIKEYLTDFDCLKACNLS